MRPDLRGPLLAPLWAPGRQCDRGAAPPPSPVQVPGAWELGRALWEGAGRSPRESRGGVRLRTLGGLALGGEAAGRQVTVTAALLARDWLPLVVTVSRDTQVRGHTAREWPELATEARFARSGQRGWAGPVVKTSDPLTPGLAQFPPQTAASPDEQKVFALWESGDVSDQVRWPLLAGGVPGGDLERGRGSRFPATPDLVLRLLGLHCQAGRRWQWFEPRAVAPRCQCAAGRRGRCPGPSPWESRSRTALWMPAPGPASGFRRVLTKPLALDAQRNRFFCLSSLRGGSQSRERNVPQGGSSRCSAAVGRGGGSRPRTVRAWAVERSLIVGTPRVWGGRGRAPAPAGSLVPVCPSTAWRDQQGRRRVGVAVVPQRGAVRSRPGGARSP